MSCVKAQEDKPIARIASPSSLKVGSFDTSRSNVRHQLADLFRYRELIKLLTIKDVKLRYKGSFLGFLWSLVHPLLMMVVYYIVFVVLLAPNTAATCSEASPPAPSIEAAMQCKMYKHYAPFILIGILAWNFTASSVMTGMSSLLSNASIAKKVYFPREVLPIASVLAQFVNFLLALVPLSLVILFSGLQPSIQALLLPIIFLSHILFLLGLALFFSVAALYFRDLVMIMEVLIQAWFFLSPVIYSMNQVFKEAAQIVYWLNPVASFIETYRAMLFFNYNHDPVFILRTCLTGVATFVVGYAFFIWKRKKIGEML